MAFKKGFKIQLRDHRTGELIQASGGMVYVAKAGDAAKETLYDMDGGSTTNPVSMTNGYFEFQVDADVNSVDLYIMAPGGHFVVFTGVKPGGPNEINIDTGVRYQVAVIPFAIGDTSANTETDTGFDEPANALFLPHPAVRVLTADAGITVSAGTLSTDSGDADGYLAAVSVASAGLVKGTVTQGSNTMGALFEVQDSANAGDIAPEAHVSGGKSITYTLAASADTAEGFLILPYVLTA